MATKISYTNTARFPRYGVVAAAKPRTYATLAQPATRPLNPLYRAMRAQTQAQARAGQDAVGRVVANGQNVFPAGPAANDAYFRLNPVVRTPAPAVPAGPSSPAPPSSSPAGSGPGSTFDMSSDPVLTQIKALGEKSVADAQTGALGLKKQALIRSGFGDIAQTLLGDAATAQAASENPLSTLAQLMQADQQRRNQIDLGTNARNTFYGSERANLLGDAARQNLFDQAQAQSALYDLLAQIDQSVLAARQAAQDQYITALPAAYDRALAAPGAAAAAAAAAAPPAATADPGASTASAGGASPRTDNVSPPPAFADTAANQLLALMLAAAKPKQPVALY